jgi:small-conductance mechanosensitive channel
MAAAVLLHWLLSVAGRRIPLLLVRTLGRRESLAYGGKTGWQIGIELGCLMAQVLVWLGALLYAAEQFPSLRHGRYLTARALGRALEAPLLMLNERHYSGYDFLWLLAVVAVLWVVVSLIAALISWRLARATGINRGALEPMSALLRYGLLLLGVIVVLQLAGINLSSLALLGGVLGVGIGFGLQSIANNFISGLLISLERPVRPGDFVSIGPLQGTVDRVGGRSTVIRTLDRVSIIVPNSKLLETEVVNWTYGDPVTRLHVPVGVAYGSDLERVRGALLEAARTHPEVLTHPRPEVRFGGFGDNALNFELLVWSADPPGQAQLRSDLYYQIEANLRRAGIEVPFPQRTLHLPAAEIDALTARLRGEEPSAAPTPVAPSEGITFPAAPGRIPDVDHLVERLRGAGGISIADRRYRLHVYSKCFVGAEAVDWLVRNFELERSEAVRLGQTLIDRGLVHHVLDEHPFRDGAYFYRFYADEAKAGRTEWRGDSAEPGKPTA